MLLNAKKMNNYTLCTKEEEWGRVKDIYFDDHYWTVRYLIVDTGGWLPGRKILVSPQAIVSLDEDTITTDLTKEQIENSPSIQDKEPVSKQFERMYAEYFSWPQYWTGPYKWGFYPLLHPFSKKEKQKQTEKTEWDYHLRSIDEVTGYSVHAIDEEFGEIDDFVIDDLSWTIRYLIVDTRKWLPGKKVLLAPRWTQVIRWDKYQVLIDLPSEAIKQAPEFTNVSMLTREFEEALHDYYKKKGYWEEESEKKTKETSGK